VSADRVLIDVTPGETRVALVERSRLVELAVVRSDFHGVAGNIYLGRVERVMSGIQAAFVDIGLERSGFLGLAEARPAGVPGGAGQRITDFVGEGDTVLVQALSDPVADKGAKLTTHVTLPGRLIVHTPEESGIHLSRRIEDGAERARLTELMEELAGDGAGFVLRTAAAGADRQTLERDVAYLHATWREIVERRHDARPPACLYRELEPICRVLRDHAGPHLREVVIDDAAALAEARRFCQRLAPDLVERLFLHDGEVGLFEDRGIEEQIDAALDPVVSLAGGGDIVIDEATALTAIDVNTGGRNEGSAEETAWRANLEAAAEVARQLRLRDIGGAVMIDFVPMRRRDNGTALLQALRDAVAPDRCPTHVLGFSRLGLVEMTRQRRRPSLSRTLLGTCPGCAGNGRSKSPETVAFAVLRALSRAARATPGAGPRVTAPPPVVAALEGPLAEALATTARRLGVMPVLVADAAMEGDTFEVGKVGDG
jgi:ribonuclease G